MAEAFKLWVHPFSAPPMVSKPQIHTFPSSFVSARHRTILAMPRVHSNISLSKNLAAGCSEDYDEQQRQHQSLLVEAYHHTNSLKTLLAELSMKNSCPIRLLERDGDWLRDQLWVAVRFLIEEERPVDALKVFDAWKNKDSSRMNVANYSKFIRLLCDENLMDEAILIFQGMEKHGLTASLTLYNDIIHGFARKKEFDNSACFLKKVVDAGLQPMAETYHGIIRAYGTCGMYDELSKCVKQMESVGCSPNEVTYNILIVEFAQGGLVDTMEGVYRTVLSKRMNLQPSTLVAMLEAYANLGIVEKMEKVYHMVMKTNAYIKDTVVRKLAAVYIENYRFARLEELGNDISARTGRTDLVWCILLLASACFLSRKGIESIIREMKVAKVEFQVTFVNILALFLLKVKDFSKLDAVLSQTGKHNRKPDIITVGILFDACRIGYDGTRILEIWRRSGFLETEAEMRTDPLVLNTFGKGLFMRDCERIFSSAGSNLKEKKHWTYHSLISLVFGKTVD
ncbi:pentatricopeptide repeat-containing protein At4g14190, chloroplastic [Dioscorea cayenensis subsp. rotundata]|uniref:Pentatricopeptide repeat-containing protein At4g14190, chloroplastic n=1 Tax=Dioscorea cayennensis subsp. rotundata TaxID=55577 RepID=A0AB40C603_DIOCR|nr:pentatricopeptide repeat-containing protein At4g14190, chloroplastic [Dioscorea cayenensis subsp. rotundata]